MIPRHLLLSVVAAAVAAAVAGCSHRVPDASPRTWELRGAIVEATEGRVRVRHTTGRMVELLLDERTAVTHDNQPRGLDVLRRGARVRVEVEPLPDGGLRARTIRVYGGGRDKPAPRAQ